MSRIADDYVDVAERIRTFKETFPEGTLQAWQPPELFHVGDKTFIAYSAAAYRTPDDQRPGVGWAWEPVPGPTNFTRDSELQNAETSAWGRAIVALGFETKKIASANEVQNRRPPATEQQPRLGLLQQISSNVALLNSSYPHHAKDWTWTDEAKKYMNDRFDKKKSEELSKAEAQQLLEATETWFKEQQKDAETPFEVPKKARA